MAIQLPHFAAFDHYPTGQGDSVMQLLEGDRGPFTDAQIGSIESMLSTANGRVCYRHFPNPGFSGWSGGYKAFAGADEVYELTFGMRFVADGGEASSTNGPTVALRNISNAVVMQVWDDGVNTTVRRGSTVLATLTRIVGIGYLEFYVYAHATEGRWELRFDGVTLASQENVNTEGATGGMTNFFLHGRRSWYINDMYVKQSTTEDRFYGPILMRRLTPTSDASVAWTPSTGTSNYAMVDEVAANQDTDYVSTNTVNALDLYETNDLPAGVNSVIGVAVFTLGRAPDGGAPLVSHVIDIGGVQSVPAGRVLSANYRTQMTVHMLQPNGNAWGEAAVNAARIGIKAV